MAKVTLSTDDVTEAFCKMLEKGIRKDVLPREDCNKYGVDMLYSRSDDAKLMFHFITLDYLEVNLELDMIEMQRRGTEYLEHLYGLLCDQTEQAREQRQEANTVTIHTGSHADKQPVAELPALKPAVIAHNEALH
jgi:hypothetical protein